MKTVSPFEYAIMQAVHEQNPDAVTKDDLANTRPLTESEIIKDKKNKIRSFFNSIKVKP